MEHVVIVGAGHAGTQLAESLRREGYTHPISLVNAECGEPYQRPPLSKDLLAVDSRKDPLPLRTRRFLADQDIALLERSSVVAVDRSLRAVILDDGRTLTYSDLVIATGGRNRALTAPGDDLAGIHYLRTASDAVRLRESLSEARRAVVVGAGFIGLEFASVARARGLDVTVIESGPRALARIVSSPVSDHVVEAHRASGIRIILGDAVSEYRGRDGRICEVLSCNGLRVPADLVVVGIGAEPNVDVAVAAGLAAIGGVQVDSYLRTADRHVWAIGDCALVTCGSGRSSRRESVQNAVDQAHALARTLTGNPTEYAALPRFWSDQGPVKLQIAGIGASDDEAILCGEPSTGRFSILRFSGDLMTAVKSVNQPAVHIAARKALTTGRAPSRMDACRGDFDLRRFVSAHDAAGGRR